MLIFGNTPDEMMGKFKKKVIKKWKLLSVLLLLFVLVFISA